MTEGARMTEGMQDVRMVWDRAGHPAHRADTTQGEAHKTGLLGLVQGTSREASVKPPYETTQWTEKQALAGAWR